MGPEGSGWRERDTGLPGWEPFPWPRTEGPSKAPGAGADLLLLQGSTRATVSSKLLAKDNDLNCQGRWWPKEWKDSEARACEGGCRVGNPPNPRYLCCMGGTGRHFIYN